MTSLIWNEDWVADYILEARRQIKKEKVLGVFYDRRRCGRKVIIFEFAVHC